MHKYQPILFKCCLLLLALAFSSSSAARQISYQMKDFSHIAHKMIGDDGQNALHIIPLSHVDNYLVESFAIKRRFIKAVNNHMLPGKSLLKVAVHTIYHGHPVEKYDEPKRIFARLHQGVPHTYAVNDGKLMFVESTGSPSHEKAKSGFSKHYVISGMQKRILVSGEFFVFINERNDQVHVVFDNASGTYQPNSRVLPGLKQVLDLNLADDGLYFHVRSFDQRISTEDIFFEPGLFSE